MSLVFQSLRSGSSGNSLFLQAGDTALLIDAGFRSQRDCRAALAALPRRPGAVLVSHLHADHINYSALQVMQDEGIPVYSYEQDVRELERRCFKGRDFDALRLETYDGGSFLIGDLVVDAFEVPHFGDFHTFGFEFHYVHGERHAKLVVASDFRDGRKLVEQLHDSDFIYVESNHDPELLRRYPNPNSRHHLRNEKCGWLLRSAFDGSERLPMGVMLGHLSKERNEPAIAKRAVESILAEGGYGDVPVHVAPRSDPSPEMRVWE